MNTVVSIVLAGLSVAGAALLARELLRSKAPAPVRVKVEQPARRRK